MAAMWNKVKKSLALKSSQTSQASESAPSQQLSDMSSTGISESDFRSLVSRSSSSLSRFSRSFSSRSSKKTCAICLGHLKTGKGQAIFTAECSHSFHFSCIANSVKHGNHLCPICRSKWKDIPLQFPINNPNPQLNAPGRSRVSPYQAPPEDTNTPRTVASSEPAPANFSDDEPLPAATPADSTPPDSTAPTPSVSLKAFTECPAIGASESVSSFAVLIGVRAPPLLDHASQLARAPIDLVTVLDVSRSMVGSKLSLLKQAVQFVIQNLGPSDRLAVVVFSSSARRIFSLRRMTDRGREDATRAVNSLSSNGGTNIVEGLKKGVRVLEERRERNPVASIILLSDGKDNYYLHNNHQCQVPQSQDSTGPEPMSDFLNTLPVNICPSNSEARDEARPPIIPVHTFGFGSDHDSASMHAISDASGGTFSFIESVGIVQDAFARCIGGLLSVVAQELRLIVEAVSTGVSIGSIPSGKYANNITEQGRKGTIELGDLYAEEEKDFLVYLSVPTETAETTSLLDVMCSYINTESKETVQVEGERVVIRRPEVLSPTDVIISVEVDRQRNRLFVAEGIAEAQQLAERRNLEGAQALLTSRRSTLLASASAQAGDNLSSWLEAELTEIRERMASMEMYEHAGRAYVLSGLSSHSWQRATTRGDSTTQTTTVLTADGRTSNTGVIGYDTPSMVSMVSKSQVLSLANHPEHFPRISKSCTLNTKNM